MRNQVHHFDPREISNRNYSNLDLNDFSGFSDFSFRTFKHCNFYQTSLMGRYLSNTIFVKCNMTEINMSGAHIIGTVFEVCGGMDTVDFGGLILLYHWKWDPIEAYLFSSVLGGLVIKIHDRAWPFDELGEARDSYQIHTNGQLKIKMYMILNYLEAKGKQYRKARGF